MRKGKLLATLLTVLAIAILVKLGFWQLDRANEKEQLFADYANRSTPTLSLNTHRAPAKEIPRFAEVSVQGELLESYLLLDNQIMDGQPGYHVIGLLEANLSDATQHIVMINMGWVPWGETRQQLPELQLPTGKVTINGYFYEPNITKIWGMGDTLVENDQWPVRVQQLDADAIRTATQLPIQPYVVLLSESAELGWPRQWQPQVMKPTKHRAYAFQWFSLAIACLLVFWFASRSKKIKTEE
jgi:surfeit locus 1 family protein